MATIYVSKKGNDSNSGLSLGLAKRSIGGGLGVAGVGDVVEVHSGHYKEGLALTNSIARSILGVGHVVMDGESTLVQAFLMNDAVNSGLKIHSLTNIEAHNYTDAVAKYLAGSYRMDLNIIRCRLYGNNIPVKAALLGSGNPTYDTKFTVQDSLIADWDRGTSSGEPIITRTTFHCGTCIHAPTRAASATSTLFISTSLAWNVSSAALINVSNYNWYRVLGGNLGSIGGTPYANLAAWRPASGKDQNSQEGDPQIADLSNEIYIPTLTSPLIQAGKFVGSGLRENIGAFAPGAAISANANSTKWGTNGVLTNVEYVSGTGRFKLAVGQVQGSIATDVLDLGQEVRLKNVRLFGLENPLNELSNFDTTNDDDDWTTEIRYSTTSFLKDDVSPSWVELNRNGEVNAIARYVQFRVTLRANATPV